jgi:hypothetical protein
MGEVLLGVVVMGGLAAVLYFVTRKRPRRKTSAAALRRQLHVATRDPQVADRLVERQREQHPRASERELVQRALEELRGDMRR